MPRTPYYYIVRRGPNLNPMPYPGYRERLGEGAEAVGRKRGEIHEAVAKHFHTGTMGYVVIAERGTASGTKKIGFKEIRRVARDRIILVNGTIIPLHRVLLIIDEKGNVLWRRGRGEEGEEQRLGQKEEEGQEG